MRFCIILFSLFLFGGRLFAQSYNEVVEEAMACVKKDSLAQAEALFQKALKMDPSNARNALLFSNLGLFRSVWERRMKPSSRIRWR